MTRYAFYCSGHGLGHSTRVVALAHVLLDQGHQVNVVTNAPQHIFAQVEAKGATYRKADIDAGVVQPKAYDVDRQQTFRNLQSFISRRESTIKQEASWSVLLPLTFLPSQSRIQAGS